MPFHGEWFGTNSLSQNLTVLPAPSEREPLAWRYSFRLNRKACGRARSPLGELSSVARLRGFKSAEPEKTVKRSSVFSGVALLFGVKRGEQPLFRGSSASKSLALFWFSFGVKREHPSATTSYPAAEAILNRFTPGSPARSGCGCGAPALPQRCCSRRRWAQ